jgi:hypothetical protein
MKETDKDEANADADSLFIGGIGQVVVSGPLACILMDTTGEE